MAVYAREENSLLTQGLFNNLSRLTSLLEMAEQFSAGWDER